MEPPFQTVRMLGVDFFNDGIETALEFADSAGGLILAPSGPGLAALGRNRHYDAALRAADLNLIDSGYLALLWQRHTGERVRRHSGLKFVTALIQYPAFRENYSQLWVVPDRAHARGIHRYLCDEGVFLKESAFYEAPFYDRFPIEDPALLERIRERRPDYVLVCVAGGKQEALGHWLRDNLDYRPAIVCIGAAIAFLSGQQARIPVWADRVYIGWLLRILAEPRTYLPRYWGARGLRGLVRRHGSEFPAPQPPVRP